MEQEYAFQCPYCWEEISVMVDASLASQSYVEDCSVCCRPIKIEVEARNESITSFEAKVLE